MADIRTARLRLRPFHADDRDWFVALHADPEVMHDYGGPLPAEEGEAKLARYRTSRTAVAIGRLAVETVRGEPIGYTGVMTGPIGHPICKCGPSGWRFMRSAWGHGFATESSLAALALQFRHAPQHDILAYTAADNLRSQRVMAKLRLRRDPGRDHRDRYAGAADGCGLVWIAEAGMAPRWT